MTRVIMGGLLAGLVMNIGEFVLNGVLLKDAWDAVSAQLRVPPMDISSMGWFVVGIFVLGIAMIWLYSVIRVKFGPGPKTAIYTGLTIWFLMWVLGFGSTALQGLYPSRLVLTTLVWGFFEVPIGALVGAWLYKQEDSTAPGQA